LLSWFRGFFEAEKYLRRVRCQLSCYPLPEIEAEIKFAEWTAGHLLRHAEFVSLREA